ncbi:MAG: hypothetical protein NTW79_00705 [Candidatus Berkelbacteria bacterium]|nr:hypothetical protein [Candidatus Berkelbacteria bacterium]
MERKVPVTLITCFLPLGHSNVEHDILKTRDVVPATADRKVQNLNREIRAIAVGAETIKAGGVVHTGMELTGLRRKTLKIGDVLIPAAKSGTKVWARFVSSERGDKLEIRFGTPLPGTDGIVPADVLSELFRIFGKHSMSIRNIWVNPDYANPGTEFANIVVSSPHEPDLPAATEAQLNFTSGSEDDERPMLGSTLELQKPQQYK